MNRHLASDGQDPFTERQSAVLDAALDLLVAGGEKAITTARIARSANCSKESLYKWFGDRDGILAAMITYQASKVRVPAATTAVLRPLDAYVEDLNAFGTDLLSVLSGPTSLALNRLAIGQVSADASSLGDLLVDRGRGMVRERAMALLERAQLAGHVRFDDLADAYGRFYGLLVADGHVRLLLGEAVPHMTDESERTAHVASAVSQFLRLYRTEDTINTITTNT